MKKPHDEPVATKQQSRIKYQILILLQRLKFKISRTIFQGLDSDRFVF